MEQRRLLGSGGCGFRTGRLDPILARSRRSANDPIADSSDYCFYDWMNEQAVIDKDKMMAPMLVACPSFHAEWEQFLAESNDEPVSFEDGGDGSLPYHLALSELANHLIAKLEAGNTKEFDAIFNVLEDWIVRGSPYVSEAAVAGLLEDLTFEGRYQKKGVSDFLPWMGPTTSKWLPEVIDYWQRLDEGKFRPLSIE